MRWNWTYQTGSKRDARFDLLRGFALLVMFINHTPVTQSWLYTFTGRGVFYISAAEGFYFISGVVLGLVSAHHPLPVAIRRVLRRAGQLYLAAVGMALFFSFLALTMHINLWQAEQELLPRGNDLLPYLINYFTLRTSFHGSSILVLYVIFMLFAPLAIWAMKRNKTWLVLVFLGLVYFISQLFPGLLRSFIWYYSNPLSWQILFFSGMVLGFHWKKIEGFFTRLPGKTIWISFTFLLASFFIWVFATNYAIFPALPKILGSREALKWERLPFVYLYLLAFILLVTLLWKPISKSLGWMLLPFGQNSLFTFLAHWGVIVLVTNLPIYEENTSPLLGAAWQALVILIILGLTKTRRSIPRSIPNWGYGMLLVILTVGAYLLLDKLQISYRIDDRSKAWQWQGMQAEQSRFAHHNTLHSGQGPGLGAKLTFEGTGIELYTWKGTTGNEITVTIDGLTFSPTSLEIPSGQLFQQKAFSIQGLSKGSHEMIIHSLGKGWLKIDYVIVKR